LAGKLLYCNECAARTPAAVWRFKDGGDTEWARRMDGLQKNGDESLGIAKPTRASAIGQVDATMTYDEWLKGKEGSKIDSGPLFAPKSDSDVWTNERLSSEGKPIMPEVVDEKSFKEWFDNPKNNFTVGDVSQHIKEALKTEADKLLFSKDSLEKQKEHHPGIAKMEYFNVLKGIPSCNEIYSAKNGNIGLVVKTEDYFRLILKTTEDRQEAYIVSLHRLNDRSLAQFRKLPRIF